MRNDYADGEIEFRRKNHSSSEQHRSKDGSQERTQREKSAFEKAEETGIPPSSVYRKIVDLKEAGVIAVDNYELDGLGRKEAKYVSTVDEIILCINAGAAEVRMIPSKKGSSRKSFTFTP